MFTFNNIFGVFLGVAETIARSFLVLGFGSCLLLYYVIWYRRVRCVSLAHFMISKALFFSSYRFKS